MKPVILWLGLLFVFQGLGVNAIKTYYLDLRCGSTLDMASYGNYDLRLRATSRSFYRSGMNCNLVISGNYGDRLMVYFDDLDIYSSTYCSKDVLLVLDGGNTTSPTLPGLSSRICGYSRPYGVYTTSGRYLTVNLQTQTSYRSGFKMIITRYNNAPCYSWQYNCNNGRCVDKSLTCNGYNPCGDHSDCELAPGAIAGIVVGCFFFFVIVLTVVILLRRRRLRYRGGVSVQKTVTTSYGTGYNQPVPQQYSYPTGQAPPPPSYQ